MSSKYKIILSTSLDITEYIIQFPDLNFSRGDYGEFPTLGNLNIQLDNTKHFFNPLHRQSLFYGEDWQSWRVNIYDKADTKIWSGKLDSLSFDTNGKQATLNAKARITEFLDKIIPFYSIENKTPAWITKDLLTLYGIPYSEYSFNKSENLQEDAGMTINAYIAYDQNLSLYDALKQLADIGIARLFIYQDKLYYETYNPDWIENSNIIVLDPPDIWKIEAMEILEKTPYLSYEIKTDTITVSNDDYDPMGKNLKSLDLTADQSFYTSSVITANYIGESYLSISQKSRMKANLLTDINLGIFFQPSTIINFQKDPLIPEYKNFEILSIDNSSNLYSKIEVQTL
jgi:hypothetical protein